MQRHYMSGPLPPAVQGEIRILEPTMAVYDIGKLPSDDPAQPSHCAWVGDRGVERARGVCVKGSSAAAPSADANDMYTI
jgi:hypothetical protein